MTRIFISHSHLDKDAAEALVEYLRASLPLENNDEIFCSSLTEHGLEVDDVIAEQLKTKLQETECLIALITEDSLGSIWTLFELGAAWVNQKHITLILGPGISPDRVPPLSGRILVKIENEILSDAVNKIAKILKKSAKPASKAIEKKKEKFIDEFKQSRCSSPVGSWLWDFRAFPATIFRDYTVKGIDKDNNPSQLEGTWKYTDRQGVIKVHWETTNTTDTLTISEDGNSMSGENNKGHENLKVIRYTPEFP